MEVAVKRPAAPAVRPHAPTEPSRTDASARPPHVDPFYGVHPSFPAPDSVVRLRTGRASLPPLAAVAAIGSALLAGVLLYTMLAVFKELAPPMIVAAILGLAAAAAVLPGWRWAPALSSVYALLLGALLIAPAAGEIAHALGQPTDGMYPVLVVFFPLLVVTIVAGTAATLQNYRHGAFSRPAPRWLVPGIATMAGIATGALVIGLFPHPSAAESVSPEVLKSLPAVRAQTFQFQQTELRVKVGETVAFRLENADAAGHYFDVDELGIHTPIPAGQSSFTLFKPSQPGTYTFYCAPHFDKASGQGMKGTLIVE